MIDFGCTTPPVANDGAGGVADVSPDEGVRDFVEDDVSDGRFIGGIDVDSSQRDNFEPISAEAEAGGRPVYLERPAGGGQCMLGHEALSECCSCIDVHVLLLGGTCAARRGCEYRAAVEPAFRFR